MGGINPQLRGRPYGANQGASGKQHGGGAWRDRVPKESAETPATLVDGCHNASYTQRRTRGPGVHVGQRVVADSRWRIDGGGGACTGQFILPQAFSPVTFSLSFFKLSWTFSSPCLSFIGFY